MAGDGQTQGEGGSGCGENVDAGSSVGGVGVLEAVLVVENLDLENSISYIFSHYFWQAINLNKNAIQ